MEEGLRWREAGEVDAWAVGEECAALGRGRTRRTARGGEKSTGGWWLPFKGAAGDSRGGARQRGRHVALGLWGLAPTDRRRPDRGPAAARVCFGSGTLTRLTRGLRPVAGEGVRSGVRAHVGRPIETWSGRALGEQ
jgi:hypothetical protein